MKKTKLSHYNKPMLFYQFGSSNGDDCIRIIFPDGKTTFNFLSLIFKHEHSNFVGPCWAITGTIKNDKFNNHYYKLSSAEIAIRKMKEFDREHGYKPAKFLGYI